MKYFEKEWKCSACGSSNSALRTLHCKSCGHPKGPQDTEIFTDNEITDEIGLQLAKGAPHWTCEYCGSVNLDVETKCTGCDNPKGSKGNTTFKVVEYGTQKPVNINSDKTARKQEVNTGNESVRKPSKKSGIFIFAGIVAAIILLCTFLFSTKNYSAVVSGVSWEREISIESFEQHHESGWTKDPDAYNVTSQSKIRSYKDVYRTETRTITEYETRYKDNGNGSTSSYTVPVEKTITEQVLDHTEPVYDTWYEYDVDRWTFQRKVTASGNDKDPYWPECDLKDVDGKYSDEREGQRKEKYTVSFEADIKGKTKSFSKDVDFEIWQDCNIGDTYKIKVNNLGAIVGDPFEP